MDLIKDFKYKEMEAIHFTHTDQRVKEMILKWRNDETVRLNMFNDEIISREEHSRFIENLLEDTHNSYWIVKKDSNWIGVVSINRFDILNQHAYLGIYVNPELQGQGFGKRLIDLLTNKIFKEARLHSLKLEVIVNNIPAINLYKKAGFKEEGRLREFVLKEKKWHDVLIMGVTKNEN